jgi:hypothetical protein
MDLFSFRLRLHTRAASTRTLAAIHRAASVVTTPRSDDWWFKTRESVATFIAPPVPLDETLSVVVTPKGKVRIRSAT